MENRKIHAKPFEIHAEMTKYSTKKHMVSVNLTNIEPEFFIENSCSC